MTSGSKVRAGVRLRPGSKPRVWLFIVALAAAAVGVYALVVAPARHVPLLGGGWWLVLIAAFAVSDLVVVHVNIGRHAHTFTSSDIPLAAGLLLLPGVSLLTSRLIGGFVALGLVRRQQPVKLAFNLAQWAAGIAGALALWTTVSVTDLDSQQAWLVALACVLLSEIVSSLSTSTVIVLDGGTVSPAAATRSVVTVLFSGLANTALVLVAVAVIRLDWRGLWAVAAMAGFVAVAQRSHVRLQRRHGALERLNDVAQRLSRDLQATTIAHEIVVGTAKTLDAASASL